MTFSLDQKLYNMKLSRKDLHEICVDKGYNISYNMVCRVLNEPGEVMYKYKKIVTDVISELESKRGITDIEF
jgi:hypothetical protein